MLRGGFLLFGEGFLLLLREAALAQLVEQAVDGIFRARFQRARFRAANEDGDAVDIELLEAAAEFLGGTALDVLTAGEQVEHARGLRDVAEVRGEDGVERLCDEAADIAETLDDARGLFIVDVEHEREREEGLVAVRGDERDAREVFVVAMRLDLAANPAQDEVHRGDVLDFEGIRIERVFAGREGFAPDAAAAGFDLFAVAELRAADIIAIRAVVADDHAHVTDGDEHFRLELDRGEPAVEEVGAVREDLQLLAATAAQGEEGLGILEVAVAIILRHDGAIGVQLRGMGADLRSDEFAGLELRSVVNGDDAEQVVGHELGRVHGADFDIRGGGADDDGHEAVVLREVILPGHALAGLAAAGGAGMHGAFGDDYEEGGIDGIHAFAEDGALAAALAALAQEGLGVLVAMDGDSAAECLRGAERFAIAGVEVADAALRNGDEGHHVDAEHPARVAEVQATAEHAGLEAGFAIQGDDTALAE